MTFYKWWDAEKHCVLSLIQSIQTAIKFFFSFLEFKDIRYVYMQLWLTTDISSWGFFLVTFAIMVPTNLSRSPICLETFPGLSKSVNLITYPTHLIFIFSIRGRDAPRGRRMRGAGPRSKSVGRVPSKAIAQMTQFFQQEAQLSEIGRSSSPIEFKVNNDILKEL